MPQFCQVCRERSIVNIQTLNPLFLINQENVIFTQECLIPKFDPFIFYDPSLKTTSYCFDGNCQNGLQLEYWQNNCFLDRFPTNLIDFDINTLYCNQIGLRTFTFNIIFDINSEFCYYNKPLITMATLKEKVFTLKTSNLKITSFNQFTFIAVNMMQFYYYDTIQMINTEFIFEKNLSNYLLFSNPYNPIDVTLINFTIKNSIIMDINSLFYAKQFGTINLQNFSIINTTIRNSSLFNLLQLPCLYIIAHLQIPNYFFFLKVYKEYLLKIQHQINAHFKMLHFLLYLLITCRNQYYKQKIYYSKEIILRIPIFYFVNNQQKQIQQILFQLLIILIIQQYLDLVIPYMLEIQKLQIIYLLNPHFYQQYKLLMTNQLNVLFMNCKYRKMCFKILNYSTYFQILIQIICYFLLQKIEQNNRSITTNQLSQIFNINSQKLDLNNFIVYNNQEILLFYIYDNEDIKLTNLFFENQLVQQKIFLSKNCFLKSNLQNQLLLIIGFERIQIENWNIINQSSIDESLIEILSSKSKQQFGLINIKNVKFYGNLLQQLNQTDRLML
ncbi:unnamed protein product [Paramecium sonneborni]|uniref:Transmembrane protein n=1 Tax=Paramecium sonneborni TaxID=65129 RepID=A0A8S1RT90_9CILI|nr:unnamed protein product [Paramecium sonneborni]